jgi:methionine synthase II (cobalamin-independent)
LFEKFLGNRPVGGRNRGIFLLLKQKSLDNRVTNQKYQKARQRESNEVLENENLSDIYKENANLHLYNQVKLDADEIRIIKGNFNRQNVETNLISMKFSEGVILNHKKDFLETIEQNFSRGREIEADKGRQNEEAFRTNEWTVSRKDQEDPRKYYHGLVKKIIPSNMKNCYEYI